MGENCPEERAKEESNEERPEVRPERRRLLCSLTLARCSLWPWRAALASAERSYSCTSAVSDEIESGRASAASDAIDSGRASAELERLWDATETPEPRGLAGSSTAVVELADCERRRCCTATPGAGGGGGIMLAVLQAVLRRIAAAAAGSRLTSRRSMAHVAPSFAVCVALATPTIRRTSSRQVQPRRAAASPVIAQRTATRWTARPTAVSLRRSALPPGDRHCPGGGGRLRGVVRGKRERGCFAEGDLVRGELGEGIGLVTA